ncbi:MAG: hypothetical protein WAQ49_04445, partial [Limnochordia bacterium]
KFDFTSTVLKDRFTTDDNKGKVEFNLDERFIKIGTDSFKFTVVKNPPSPFRIRLEKVSADVWPKDWRPYDHFAVWVYICFWQSKIPEHGSVDVHSTLT